MSTPVEATGTPNAEAMLGRIGETTQLSAITISPANPRIKTKEDHGGRSRRSFMKAASWL
jgi:hypothetical protein